MKAMVSTARLCALLMLAVVIGSCGGGDDGEPSHPPSISNLAYSPLTAVQAAGGTVAINAAVDFRDAGGDVASVRFVNNVGSSYVVQTPSLSGTSSGRWSGTFRVPTDTAGKYTFDVWMADGRGTSSNRLSGSYEVLPRGTLEHPPAIGNLRYSPSTAIQGTNATVTIETSVDFTDTGGDVVAMRLRSSAGAEFALPTFALGGVKSGTATGSFAMPVGTVGSYTFEVWLTDSKGSSSNRLSGRFDVVAPTTADTWTTAVTSAQTLYGVGWNGRNYVAVGAQGAVMTSTDQVNWTVQTTGVTHTLRSVAASASRIVAVGHNDIGEAVVLSSADGAAWSVRLRAGACADNVCSAPAQLSKVIWTGSLFVAVGQERGVGAAPNLYALVLTSTDGLTWTQPAPRGIDLGAATDVPLVQRLITSVAWSGSRFVMVGIDATGYDPTVWTSSDAQTWSRSPALPTSVVWGIPWSDVTWGNGRFVAVGPPAWEGDSPVFWSADGLTWQADTTASKLPAMSGVTFGPGEFLAVGDGYRQTSPDGSTWKVSPAAACGKGVMWDGRRYLAVGASICRSP